MRWKMLLVVSLLAAAAGAGAGLLLAHGLRESTRGIGGPGGAAFAGLLLPAAAVAFAFVFVYRHTARRRKLQALAAALLTAALVLAALLAGSAYLSPRAPDLAPTRRDDEG